MIYKTQIYSNLLKLKIYYTHFDRILSGTVGNMISLLSKVILGKMPSPVNLILI
jgi:hypothetical protein